DLIVALTDHNTVSGVPKFLEEASRCNVTAVAGVELSTEYDRFELHLLGLFLSPEHFRDVEQLAKEFHVLKEISNMEMVERLNDAGYHIDYFAVKRRNPNGNANRAHVAAELLEHGYVSSIMEAFKTILAEGNGFYTPPSRLKLVDAIRFLRDIHALPILAHPLQDLTETEFRNLLPDAVAAGLLGIETYHSSYSQDQLRLAWDIAEEYHLHKSGGSDFHGSNKPAIRMGMGNGDSIIPESVYHDLMQLHQSLHS
ncbi:MAG: hypothetical protein Q4B18_09110, partial [Bacillota bacterium]|nr:hypothetical protein [Bacillota bacterium]